MATREELATKIMQTLELNRTRVTGKVDFQVTGKANQALAVRNSCKNGESPGMRLDACWRSMNFLWRRK
jgi:hypothetical protein